MAQTELAKNYVNNRWTDPAAGESVTLCNPATREDIVKVPLTDAAKVSEAVDAAAAAFPGWRKTPPEERIQYLFRLRELLVANLDDLARTITIENGKTLAESRGELQRGIENVEVACGIPTLMQGYNLEDIARGIDEMMIRQPLGVVAIITPFNFPGMIPLWFLPYAIACGNTVVVKPSEKVPLTMQKLFSLIEQLDLPPGVINLVNGSKEAVDTLARTRRRPRGELRRLHAGGQIHLRQSRRERQARPMPGRSEELRSRHAGRGNGVRHQDHQRQRLRMRRPALPRRLRRRNRWRRARQKFRDAIADVAGSLKVGFGLDDGVQMGPVISAESKARIEGCIAEGVGDGAKALLDGRGAVIDGYRERDLR